MSRRAVLACFLYFAEGLRLTFGLFCGIAGPTATHSSGGLLIQPQDHVRQTTMMDPKTNPVGEKDQKTENMSQKTENGSKVKNEKDSGGGCCCVIL